MQIVCGIHGAGKTIYCNNLSRKTGLKCYSASELIGRSIAIHQEKTKKIDQINVRQKALIQELGQAKQEKDDFLLDGHLCLIDQEDRIVRLPTDLFENLGITKILVVKAKPMDIAGRLKQRNDIIWTVDFIDRFQQEELRYAHELAKILGVDIEEIDTSTKVNIVLPVAPIYANKILSGEKKYEYRKKLSKTKIKMIYIYATSPIKSIIGEVNVINTLSMVPDALWELTSANAGVTYKDYKKYFEDCQLAHAYKLGKAYGYQSNIDLESIGINFTPQSYIYVADI